MSVYNKLGSRSESGFVQANRNGDVITPAAVSSSSYPTLVPSSGSNNVGTVGSPWMNGYFSGQVQCNSISTTTVTATTVNATNFVGAIVPSGDFLPITNAAFDIGSTLTKWKDVYWSGIAYGGGLSLTAQALTRDIIPTTTNAYDIGSNAVRYKDAYLSGTATATDINANTIVPATGALTKALGSIANQWTTVYAQDVVDQRSVKYYGAVGDNIADDTAAIQAALNTAKVVIFPPGAYKCTSTLVVPPTVALISASGAQIRTTATVGIQFGTDGSGGIFVGTVVGLVVIGSVSTDYSIVVSNIADATFQNVVAFTANIAAWYLHPGHDATTNSRISYSVFDGCEGMFAPTGLLLRAQSPTAWCNECVWTGGRFSGSSYPVQLDASLVDMNQHRFFGVSMESTGASCISSLKQISGSNCMYVQCRHEGTFSGARVHFDSGTSYNHFTSTRYDSVVTDQGTANVIQTPYMYRINNLLQDTGVLVSRASAQTGTAPILELVDTYNPSGVSVGISYKSVRPSGTLLYLQGWSASGGAVTSVISGGATNTINNTGSASLTTPTANGTALNVVRTGASNTATPVVIIADQYAASGNSVGAEIQLRRGNSSGFYIRGYDTLSSTVKWSVDGTGAFTLPSILAFSGTDLIATTGTTAPSAGAADALPATPTGYLTVKINGANRQIPYY